MGMRGRMASTTVFLFATFLVPLLSQTKFSDPQKTQDVDKKIFTGDPTLDTLGGGLIGVGLGALGGSVLGPTIGQVLGGGNTGFGSQTTSGGCGRRGRQADGETRVFLPSGGSCTCSRRKRQASAKGEGEPNTKFFGNLFGGNDQNCGACSYSQGYNQGASNNQGNYNQGYNQGSHNQGSSNQGGRCQCDYNKTFTDQNGRTHGACRRADNSGRTLLYNWLGQL